LPGGFGGSPETAGILFIRLQHPDGPGKLPGPFFCLTVALFMPVGLYFIQPPFKKYRAGF
jgi:hypothetical protein